MVNNLAKWVVEVLQDGGVDAELYQYYSGRDMYGKTTTGVVFEGSLMEIHGHLFNACLWLDPEDPQIEKYQLEDVGHLKTDSLGMRTILY
jgi:hypothetical protein